jgi:AraC family transcriptional regulator
MDAMNRAMRVIEDGLEGEVDMSAVARAALVSEHHFRRMFSALAGIPVSEYVRRRRMTLAAAAVLRRDEAVQDIAVRFGYTSADAFSRAFRTVHGIGPEQARRPGAVLRSQPPLTFRLTIEGSTPMDYRIVHTEAFTFAGYRARVPLVYEGVNSAAAEFTKSITAEQWKRLHEIADLEPGVVTVMDQISDTREEGSELDHWIAAATTSADLDGLETLEVEPRTWVVFSASGPFPESLQNLWVQAYGEWFPANPWQTTPGPEIAKTVFHPEGGTGDFELWLPVEPQ